MPKPKFVFRCDAAELPEIGTGHVIRSMTLARGLVRAGLADRNSISFVANSEGEYAIGRRLLDGSEFSNLLFFPEIVAPNSAGEVAGLIKQSADVYVVDRLDTSEALIAALSARAKVVSFDDHGSGAGQADVVFNAIVGSKAQLKNEYSTYDYLVLHEQCNLSWAPDDASCPAIFVCFGGYDARGLTRHFLREMSGYRGSAKVLIVSAEPGSSFADELKVLDAPIFVEFVNRPSYFYGRLAASTIAIVSGGLLAFDCSRMGVPSIGVPQYPHQLETLKRLEAMGACVLGADGMSLSSGGVLEPMVRLLGATEELKKMSDIARACVDGNGLARVVDRINNLLL